MILMPARPLKNLSDPPSVNEFDHGSERSVHVAAGPVDALSGRV